MNTTSFNVLITSLSKKVPLIREVKKALSRIDENGIVIGADCDDSCIGRYFSDDFWQMPPTDDLDFNLIREYCLRNEIKAVIPTRDGELPFFSEIGEALAHEGVGVMVSSPEGVKRCVDKLLFFEALQDAPALNAIRTSTQPDISGVDRWVVKEQSGSGSRSIRLNVSTEQAAREAPYFFNPIFQPWIEGQEFSVDIYQPAGQEARGCVVRSRDVIVCGESQVTTISDYPAIENICLEAAGILGLSGHVVFQAIVDKSGRIHLLECNSRFGGGSTISVAAGLDSFYWFFLETLGKALPDIPFVRGRAGFRQVRHAEDMFFEP